MFLAPSSTFLGQAAPTPADFTFSVASTYVWTDTGLDLQPGDLLQISAGTEESSAPDRHALPAAQCDPGGTTAAASGTTLPLPSAPMGALIAKLHPSSTGILIGAGSELRIEEPSHLFLGINIGDSPVCQGIFRVKVHKTAAPQVAVASKPDRGVLSTQSQTSSPDSNSAKTQSSSAAPASGNEAQAQMKSRSEQLKSQLSTAAQILMAGQFGTGKSETNPAGAAPAASSATGAATTIPALKVSDSPLDAELRRDIESLPRRVNDQFKNLGDMVNFVMVGSEKDVQAALEAANWHVADTNNQKAVLAAVLQTYEKKDYLQMPMSMLYLFDRPQDFGYEQAEPIAMVASRHHFRIWKAPFKWKDQEVWVGAGTHDIGFAKDQRNGSVTHKIDPAVDGERDNIGSSLEKGGKIKSLNYYLPANPVQEAKNATGDSYHSDGRLLVIFLQ